MQKKADAIPGTAKTNKPTENGNLNSYTFHPQRWLLVGQKPGRTLDAILACSEKATPLGKEYVCF